MMGFNDHPLILRPLFKQSGEVMNMNTYPSTKDSTQELSLFSIIVLSLPAVSAPDIGRKSGQFGYPEPITSQLCCNGQSFFWRLSACICKLVNVISALQGWGEHENVGDRDGFDMLGW